MRYLLSGLILSLLVTSLMVGGQTATIWGPGENYEITYLHSGNYRLNGTDKISFTNEPSAEFTISNITNDGYDYIFLGYNQLSDMGEILMQEINFGFGSIVIPNGGLPFVLPLSYGQEDEYLKSFSSKIDTLSSLGEINSGGLFSANSSTDNEYMYLEFAIDSEIGGMSDVDAFVDLPSLELPEFKNNNVTYVNSSFTGAISYKLSTGVLFELNFQLEADEVLVDDVSRGAVKNSQSLEFVAIIPPASIIDELNFNVLLIGTSILLIIPLRRKLRDLVTN